jgi:hypothetical protein
MQYQNQRKPSARPIRLGMFLLVIILLALIGFTQMEKARNNTNNSNATSAEASSQTNNLTVVLDPVAVAQAQPIEYKILSSKKGEVNGFQPWA